MYWVLPDLIVPSDSSAAAPELEQQRRTAEDIRLPFARGIVYDTLWRFMRDKDVGSPLGLRSCVLLDGYIEAPATKRSFAIDPGADVHGQQCTIPSHKPVISFN